MEFGIIPGDIRDFQEEFKANKVRNINRNRNKGNMEISLLPN
jgi:hypothetical protein